MNLLVLTAILATQLFASSNSFEQVSSPIDDGADLIVVADKKGKYGYKLKGEEKFKIKPKFVEAKPFTEGIAIVSIEGKKYPEYGTINLKGKYIIKPKYKTIEDYIDGLAKVETEIGWGLVNMSGEEILKPEYITIDGFIDGLARVETVNGWGLVNKAGEEVLPTNYKKIEDFVDGLAKVETEAGWGLINKNGVIIIEPIFQLLLNRQVTGLWECTDENGFLSLYDSKGNQYLGIEDQYCFQELIGRVYRLNKEADCILLRADFADGQNIVEKVGGFDKIIVYRQSSEGTLYLVSRDGKWGLLNDWADWITESTAYEDVDISNAPSSFVFSKDGYKYLFKRGGECYGPYSVIQKGYLNDWVLIGEATYSIISPKSVIEGEVGTNNDNFSIEMLDKSDSLCGTYLIKKGIDNSSQLVYSDGRFLETNHKYRTEDIRTFWNQLTDEIQKPLIKEILKEAINITYPQLAFVKSGEKWGAINTAGKIIVPFKYDSFLFHSGHFYFQDGVAIIQSKDNKFVILDSKGNEITPCYDYIECGSGWPALVHDGDYFGFVDKNGRQIVPIKYTYATCFNDGFSVVFSEDGSAIINENGEIVLYPKEKGYEVANSIFIQDRKGFSSGLLLVIKDGKVGYINTEGTVVIPFMYDWGTPFWGDYALVRTSDRIGYINRNGKELEVTFTKYSEEKGNEYATALLNDYVKGNKPSKLLKVKKEGRWGCVNENGDVVVPFKYEEVGESTEGMTIVKNNGKYGFVNSVGSQIVQCIYDDVFPFEYGRALVHKDGACGVINKNGTLIVPCKYLSIWPFSEDCVATQKDFHSKTVNIINFTTGKRVEVAGNLGSAGDSGFLKLYDNIPVTSSFRSLFAQKLVDEAGNTIYINAEPVDNAKEYHLGVPVNGYAMVIKGDKYGFINEHGEEVVPCIYDDANNFSYGEELLNFKGNKFSKGLTESVNSWIVGTWYAKTLFGTSSIYFSGDGSKGQVVLLEDALDPYSAKYGTYYVDKDALYCKLKEKPNGSFSYGDNNTYTEIIEIRSGHKLYMGDGCYYVKIE